MYRVSLYQQFYSSVFPKIASDFCQQVKQERVTQQRRSSTLTAHHVGDYCHWKSRQSTVVFATRRNRDENSMQKLFWSTVAIISLVSQTHFITHLHHTIGLIVIICIVAASMPHQRWCEAKGRCWAKWKCIKLLFYFCTVLIDNFSQGPSVAFDDKILFVPSHLSAILNEGGAVDELFRTFGTYLGRFRKSLSGGQMENGTHFHSR